MARDPARRIFIVSDGTGRTCEQVLRSALVQFEDAPIEVTVRAGIRSVEKVRQVVCDAAEAGATIFFTLVSEKTRKAMKDNANEQFVEAVDVLGPVFSGLNSIINRRVRARPGHYYRSERVYFDRMDAIDYTLKHDDGQRLHGLGQADVVLAGVSRVSKSSTCFYLAYRGIRAANVPLFGDREPPRELTRLHPKRVVGLVMNCRRLVAIRQARLHQMGVTELDRYVDAPAIASELRATHRQMSKHGWRQIDVSYLAIEEIAKQVRRLMQESGLRRRPRGRRQPR
ncbi:MAG: pyruvate, water dikinase regulatory protein [Planctomycetota bacterium]|jgi:regulator of PEP synthase PpsR (kinase-PPPase family)